MVRARLERAPVLAQGLHVHRDREPVPHMGRGRVHDDPGPEPPGRLADPACHPGRDLLIRRERARCEPRTRGCPRFHAVDPERAPVGPVQVPGHQVPATPVVDQAVRLHRPAAGGPGMRSVAEPEPLVVPARGRDHGQHLGVDLRAAGRYGQRVGAERGDPVAQPGRKNLLKLGQRADRGLLDSGDRAARGGTQSDRHRHRLVVVEQQRRQDAAGAQPVPAGHAGPGVDRITEAAQPVHVIADGTGGDAEAAG
jgi:hypothetical protein